MADAGVRFKVLENNVFDSIKIGLASPEQIGLATGATWKRGQKGVAEVCLSTINYRTLPSGHSAFNPVRDGLYCERIHLPLGEMPAARPRC